MYFTYFCKVSANFCKFLWKVLFFLLIGITLLFLSINLYKIYSHLRLNSETTAQIEKFEILSSKRGSSVICVNYFYEVKNKTYRKNECLNNFYMNKCSFKFILFLQKDVNLQLAAKQYIEHNIEN